MQGKCLIRQKYDKQTNNPTNTQAYRVAVLLKKVDARQVFDNMEI